MDTIETIGKIVLLAIAVGIAILIIRMAFLPFPENTEKFDKCIELANEIGLDPNDEKVEFIKTCMQ